jgi:hypothetical protein
VFRIEQNGRMSLERTKPLIKGGSAPDEEEEESNPMDHYPRDYYSLSAIYPLFTSPSFSILPSDFWTTFF